jgi:predicted NBD/HSP70 family sugar kinase
VTTRTVATVTGDPDRTFRDIGRLTRAALRASGVPPELVANATVALPGLVDRHGHCTIAPNLGWREVPVADRVASLLGVPTTAVNSTQASAYAESIEGVARDARSFVWLYVGSGIGSALVEDGALVQGSSGFAGEIGHCRVSDEGPLCRCGKRGCLEVFAAAPAILAAARRARRRGSSPPLATVADVVQAASTGDTGTRDVLQAAGRWLGLGTSYLVSILNPELVVVGGEAALAGDLLLDPLRTTLAVDALTAEQVPVVASTLPGDAALRGAGLVALHRAPADRVGSAPMRSAG